MKHSHLPSCQTLLGVSAALALALAGCTQAPAPAAVAAQPATPVAEAPTEAAPPPVVAPQPAVHKSAAPRRVHHHAAASAPERVASGGSNPEPSAAPARQPITVCTSCGVISAITPVKSEGKGTAIGVVAGGLAGLIVGNQIGGGNGKTIAKVAGAAGGAYIGNKIEKKVRAETSYEIKVRLDDGTETTVTQETAPKLAVGDAVRIVDGNVVAK